MSPISGIFSVNDKNEAVLVESSKPENSLTVNYTQAVSTSDQGTDFYVTIPPETYQDLKIEISADGKDYKNITTKTGADIVIERNKIYSITPTTLIPNPTTGLAKAVINSIVKEVRWIQLWSGGPKFAEFNVGAAHNNALDYGGYYVWGGSRDKVDDHNEGKFALTGDSDTATKLWGSAWRMPTYTELKALIDNCNVEWTTVSGVNGRKFTGKAAPYTSNSVFLPAAGYYYNGNVNAQGGYGYYWSSTPSDSFAIRLLFYSDEQEVAHRDSRRNGYSVRAVLAE